MIMEQENNKNGWNEHRLLVMASLETLNDKVDKIDTQLNNINNQVIILKVKASLYGGIVGLLVSLIFKLLISKIN